MPNYRLDHVVRERYPTFATTCCATSTTRSVIVFLFATTPAYKQAHARRRRHCQRLALEWQAFVVRSGALVKAFVSIKGVYYQAVVARQCRHLARSAPVHPGRRRRRRLPRHVHLSRAPPHRAQLRALQALHRRRLRLSAHALGRARRRSSIRSAKFSPAPPSPTTTSIPRSTHSSTLCSAASPSKTMMTMMTTVTTMVMMVTMMMVMMTDDARR
jgi:hypothetical protein